MDLDKALVSAILKDGPDALTKALSRGVTAARLHGEGQQAFKFVQDYYAKYGTLPVVAQIEGKTGIVFDDTEDIFVVENVPPRSADWFTDEINNRHLHIKIQQGLKDVSESQEKRSPLEAYGKLERLLESIREEQLGISPAESLFKVGPQVQSYYESIKAGQRGVQTPWPTINEATLGLWPEDLCLFVARIGVGKCVHADTEIYDPDTGISRTIEQIYGDSETTSIATWSKDKGVHVVPITAKVDTGTKTCLKFRLGTGREITVTPEHPFLTAEGWKRADQLRAGCSVAIPHKMPFPTSPVALDPAELDALAILLAEGSTTGNHLGFSSADPKIIDICERAAESMEARVVYRSGVDYDFVGTKHGSNKVLDLARREGVWRTLAKHKTVPDSVFRLPPEQLSRFLALFWMCDGYVSSDGVGITLASKKMVYQLQSLLLRFGIQSSIHFKTASVAGRTFDAWRLRVYSESLSAFCAYVPLWDYKFQALREHVEKDRNSNIGFPRVSDAFVADLRSRFASNPGRHGDMALSRTGKARGWGSYFGFRNLFGKNSSLLLGHFAEFCRQVGAEAEFRWLWDPSIFWDSIESIVDVGEQKIYDLTVEPTECFIANDIIVHNTWSSVILALHAWQTPRPVTGDQCRVMFITTEVSKQRIAMRLYALKEKLNYYDLTHGSLSSAGEEKLKRAVTDLIDAEGLYLIGGDFNFELDQVEQAIESRKPDLVIIDGVYLLKVPGANRTEKMANTFDEVKRLAKRKKVPIIITTQFNREVKANQAKTVQMESIAMSDVGGWNADLIFGLVQSDEMKAARTMQIKPLKVREGTAKEFLCNWDFGRMDFSELVGEGDGNGDAAEGGTGMTDGPLDDGMPF